MARKEELFDFCRAQVEQMDLTGTGVFVLLLSRWILLASTGTGVYVLSHCRMALCLKS